MQDKLIEESRCAHKRVVHRPMPIEGGLWTDRWYCDLCRCEFTPLAVRRSHCDAGTDEGLRKALAEGLSWALDLLDMYDKKLIEMGEPAELVYAPIHLAGKEKARKTLQASHAAESASTAPLNAADQSARNAGCNCSRKIPYLDFSHEKTCPLYSWTCGSSTAQLDAEDQHPKMRAANAEARKGYVKLEDVEKAIREVCNGTWCGSADFIAKIKGRLAPKPSPSLAEEIDALLLKRGFCVKLERDDFNAELAALVDRRTK